MDTIILTGGRGIRIGEFLKMKLKLFKHNGFCKSLNSKKDIQEIEERGLPSTLKF